MATAILDSLEAATMQHHHEIRPQQLGGRESVLSLAADIQTILRDAKTMATIKSP